MNLSRLLFLSLFVCFVLSNQDNDEDNFSDFDDQPDSELEDNVEDNNYNSTEPEPEFFYRKETYKSGAKKGKTHDVITLIAGPYIFKKRKEYKNGAQFSCNECQKEGYNSYAQATKTGEFTDDGIEKYNLKSLPNHELYKF